MGGFCLKLLMIQAWNSDETSYRGKFSELLSYPSLTLAVLYSLIPNGIFDKIDVVDESSQRVNYDREQYDLVMISFETSSALSAYRHCKAFRERGAYTVCGGYHATALPDEVAEYCDTVIVGPAENAVPEFIRDFTEGAPKPRYCDFNICAADFPIPARDKITGRKKLKIPAIIANRGCANHCKYCSMTGMWKNDRRPIESVVNEIRSLHTKMLIFYDPNFFGDRNYALSLMEAIKPLKVLWAADATADFGYDHELMQAAYDSGCRGVLIGMESMNPDSLKSAAKRFYKADKYKEIVDNIHSHGIGVNGCFVLGFDNDTEEELLALPERIEHLGLDLCRFAMLTPYPGTRLFDEFDRDSRITTKNWSLYNQHIAVFLPKNITAGRLNEIYRQVWKKAYTWKSVMRRVWGSPLRKTSKVFVLLGANIGFKFLGIDKKYKK